ncbi:MAG: RNA-binding domain-containing protein [Anaerolineae bacterium]
MTNRRHLERVSRQWYRVDLHIHTPASADYAQLGVSYLDILRRAALRGLDIIAFTDHNTVAGYAAMKKEIETLELLNERGRILPEEKQTLQEYCQLLSRVLVLPGFEFTATLGFHILGIFPPDTSIRDLEYVLRRLNVPAEQLDAGSTEVGATVDVLTAYRIINEAGGLVIAAHVNAAHGVALQGFDFGGQTRIAYTQDPHLHALEVTDLESRSPRRTALFFNGSKPGYPRRMHCIQGSDAHCLIRPPEEKSHLGVGDRVTEMLLNEPSFEAILEVFQGQDFARTRPYRAAQAPFDHIQAAREQGSNIVQSFHETMARRGGRLHAILCDVCAFANTNGGTIYIGVSANPKVPPVGIESVPESINSLRTEIERHITPPLPVTIDALETGGKTILRVVVPAGKEPPYAVDDSKIYIRNESETVMAVRDEIVALTLKTQRQVAEHPLSTEPTIEVRTDAQEVSPTTAFIPPPKTGVEIVESDERKGIRYYSMKDLRNGDVVHNVTQRSARRLWRYAITQHNKHPIKPEEVHWEGSVGLLRKYRRAGKLRYDLVQRDLNGNIRVYYGVTEEGIFGPWRELVGNER